MGRASLLFFMDAGHTARKFFMMFLANVNRPDLITNQPVNQRQIKRKILEKGTIFIGPRLLTVKSADCLVMRGDVLSGLKYGNRCSGPLTR